MADGHNEAAVGLMVNNGSILLIKRVKRDGDPWSGHIALPGGFVQEGETVREAVLREIYEETALKPEASSITGELPIHHPTRKSSVSVHPFVLSVDSYSDARPGDEVDDIKVIPVSSLVHRKKYIYGRDVYLADDWVVWGLTYRILTYYFSTFGKTQS